MPLLNPLFMLIPGVLWLVLGPFYINYLRGKMLGQFIREDGPQHHLQKAGTPTMGGLLIVLTVVVSMIGFLIYAPYLSSKPVWLCLFALLVFAALGFSDDWLKINKRQNKGLSGWTKLGIQVAVGLIIGFWGFYHNGGVLNIFSHNSINLGWLYPIFAALVITGASNAYNLTDGLDGLAGGTGAITFLGFAFILAMLQPPLALLSLLLAGGCLGFLAFNRYPAKIFMGDSGSLALGGVMGALAVLGRIELYLLLLGGIYVLETLSVILQVGFFKVTKGKRLFKMSPLHHHFELCGWHEVTVVTTFAVAQLLFSTIAVLMFRSAIQ